MFHEVRIKFPDGKLKKVVNTKALERLHWKHFEDGEERIGLLTTSQRPVPDWVKRNLDILFPEHYELSN